MATTKKTTKKPTSTKKKANAEVVHSEPNQVACMPAVITMTKKHRLHARLQGMTPYICHRMSEKIRKKMLFEMMHPDKKETATGKQREPKDPWEEFYQAGYLAFKKEGKKYVVSNLCCKLDSLKNALADSAAYLGDKRTLTKKDTKRALFIEPVCNYKGDEVIPLTAAGPLPPDQFSRMDEDPEFADRLAPFHAIGISMHEALVTVGQGQSDLRYRPYVWKWYMDVVIEYTRYPRDLVLTLLQESGNGGIGENRPTSPKSTGTFGRFEIATSDDWSMNLKKYPLPDYVGDAE